VTLAYTIRLNGGDTSEYQDTIVLLAIGGVLNYFLGIYCDGHFVKVSAAELISS